MFTLMELPYSEDALEPQISQRTVGIHYHKHHQGYVDKLNRALQDSGGEQNESTTLEDLIVHSEGKIFNFAAQIWNHNFYWQSLAAPGSQKISAGLEATLQKHFDSVDAFIDEFKSAATSEFGSGWAWLVKKPNGALKILSTTDANNPLRNGDIPLITVDVWEHAYYLDYQNERGTYLDALFSDLLNWGFLESNLTAAQDQTSTALAG